MLFNVAKLTVEVSQYVIHCTIINDIVAAIVHVMCMCSI